MPAKYLVLILCASCDLYYQHPTDASRPPSDNSVAEPSRDGRPVDTNDSQAECGIIPCCWNGQPDYGDCPQEPPGIYMAALPTGRSITLNPGDPVPSALLNELQDQIIGAKFGEIGPTLSGSDFQLVQGTGVVSDGTWTFSVVPAKIICGLKVPSRNTGVVVNPTIVASFFGFNTGGAGTVTYKIRGRNIATNAAAFDIATAANSGAAGYVNVFLTSATPAALLPYVKAAEVSVWLEVSFSNTANTFGGALPSWRNL